MIDLQQRPNWLGSTGMNIRDALLTMAPSLTLHRAAADELARCDKQLAVAQSRVRELETRPLEHWSIDELLAHCAQRIGNGDFPTHDTHLRGLHTLLGKLL